jgi:hypothetical protein
MKLTRRRNARYVAALSATFVALPMALVAIASPAAADTWPFNSNFRPDTGNHNYCYSTTYYPRAEVRTEITNSMVYMNDNTDAKRSYHSTCDTAGDGQTDVVWRQQAPTGGAIGTASCSVKWASGRCDRYEVRLNVTLIREKYSSEANRNRQYRKTSCHELGHTLGLDHYTSNDDRHNNGDRTAYTSSCQRSGWTGENLSSWTRTWESHHRGHINAWF